MRYIIGIFFLTSLLFGYQQGDAISPDVIKKLNIEENKIYVIDFFASWCDSCKKEMPLISKANDLADKKKVEFIGVDVDEDIKEGQAFQKGQIASNSLNFRVVDDPKSEIIGAFNPVGMPALFIIKNNKVASMIVGAADNIDKTILNKLKGLE